MARVNFYLLPQQQESARRQFACRLAEKLWRQGLRVQVQLASAEEAQELDQLLWSFSAESFLPHHLQDQDVLDSRSVVLSWGPLAVLAPNLLNLDDGMPSTHERFETIAEFVLDEDSAKTQSRELWNRYRQAGHELLHHRIGA
jgi:DNA polymerase-3 subunit chi